jgi:hypothetical protein
LGPDKKNICIYINNLCVVRAQTQGAYEFICVAGSARMNPSNQATTLSHATSLCLYLDLELSLAIAHQQAMSQ